MHEYFADILKPNSADAKLLSQIDTERLPKHVAVIMDGNGRWAKQRGKPRIFGHRAGAESVKAIIDTCGRLQIKAVTLYAFSTENWKRPKAEVSGLMQMLKKVLRRELDEVTERAHEPREHRGPPQAEDLHQHVGRRPARAARP